MADFTTTYKDVEPETALSGQRRDVAVVDGPAKFLALAVNLGVPVLSRKQLGSGGVRSAGGGLSFAVARTNARIKLRKGLDWANDIPPYWFDRVETRGDDLQAIVVKNYVNKRIMMPRLLRGHDECENDARTFVAMTTEMKILAHEAIRKSVNIVSLVAISWNTRETSSRFWPEIFLEGAQHGNVNQYLQVSPSLNLRSKVLMLIDIAAGLAFLHENGIVHCDVKPGNMLVCDSPERQALESIGVVPVIVKLCDFGCSVILSDYPEYYRFSIKVGTPGWMAPEIEQGLLIQPAMLVKTDIYSLGLVAATIFTGVRPSPGILPKDVTGDGLLDAKHAGEPSAMLSSPGQESSTKSTKRKRCDVDEEEQMPGAQSTCDEKSGSKAECGAWMDKQSRRNNNKDSDFKPASAADMLKSESLDEQQSALLRKIILGTLQPGPSDRKEAREIYDLCRAHVLKEGRHSELELLGTVLPGCPDKNHEDLKAQVMPDKAGIPDFAFEKSLRTGQLHRQCQMEVFRDLERRVANNASDAGDCALQLAALIANGYLVCNREMMEEEIERYLTSAVTSGNQLAISGAINILDAMGRKVHHDMRRQVLDGFRNREFRLQAVTEIKSLFFPLSFGPTIAKPRMPGAVRFPFAHKYNIQARLYGVRTWKREFREEFIDFLLSREYHQLLSVIPISLLEPEDIDWPKPDSPRLSSSMVAKFTYDSCVSLENMTSHEQDGFMDEIQENKVVNEPTEVGLTLLQLAACRGDEATASVLLDTLGADVNAYGKTAHWTPLWLACFLGHIDMATFLVGHGADLTCTDSSQGLTILHLLSQFTTKDGVEGIGCEALAAGVDINAKSEYGITPLLAAMLVFDYSSGATIEFLLENGADPLNSTLARSELYDLPVSPLSLCVLNLDTDLLEQMLSAIPQNSGVEGGAHKVALLQEVGFQLMCSQTTFGSMFQTGSKYRRNLKRILQAVVNLKRTNLFWMSPYPTPLAYAFDMDRADIMEMLLVIDPDTPLEVPQLHEPDQRVIVLLEECIMRHNVRAVNALIRHGADMLKPTGMGDTSLSCMAKEMPSMLLDALDYLENLPIAARGGKTVQEILEIPQLDTPGIFDCIVLNGSSDDLVIAEALRAKYGLNHDHVQPLPPNTTTLIGASIVWSFSYGYDRLAQIRYLLSLEPKPKFLLPSGVNLFTMALMSSDESKAVEHMELLRLLFNAYPDMDNLTQGWRHLLPALHRAASGTNLEVLRLMQEHVEFKHPGKSLPYNHVHLRNEIPEGAVLLTMLDCCRFGIVVPGFNTDISHLPNYGEEGILGMSAFDLSKNRDEKKRIYQYLREQGAVHGWELDGYFISGRILWTNSLPVDDFRQFLEKLTRKYSLDPWEHGPEPDAEFPSTWFPFAWREVERYYGLDILHDTKGEFTDLLSLIRASPAMSTPKTQLRICELVWRGNNFCLRAWDLPFASTRLLKELSHYFSTRVRERERWVQLNGATPPYKVTSYRESPSMWHGDATDMAPYTRHGRVWKENEVAKLSDDIFRNWAAEFGKLEEDIPDELRATVMSYF